MQNEEYHPDSKNSITLLLAARELFDLAQLEFAVDANARDGLIFAQLGLRLFRVHIGIPPFASDGLGSSSFKVTCSKKGSARGNLR
jgi:hypothetical protein